MEKRRPRLPERPHAPIALQLAHSHWASARANCFAGPELTRSCAQSCKHKLPSPHLLEFTRPLLYARHCIFPKLWDFSVVKTEGVSYEESCRSNLRADI